MTKTSPQTEQKLDTLKNISRLLDQILDKPAEEWTNKEVQIYHLLQGTLEKYKIRYSIVQFRLDIMDIKRNVKACPWYQESPYRKTVNWCLDQLVIKSYKHSKKTGNFQVVARLTQAQITITILKKDKFYFSLQNECTGVSTQNLDDQAQLAKIFQISPKVSAEQKAIVTRDLGNLVREIGMFYN